MRQTPSLSSLTRKDPFAEGFSIGLPEAHTRPLPSLPLEMILSIFTYLSAKDLSRAMCVCREWRDIGTEDSLWKSLWTRTYPYCQSLEIENYREAFIRRCDPPSNIMQSIILQNIANGNYHKICLSEGPTSAFRNFCYVDGLVLSFSKLDEDPENFDEEAEPPTCLKLWDVKTGTLLLQKFAANHLRLFAFGDNKLFMLNETNKNSIEVVDMLTGSLLSTLDAPPGRINSLQCVEGRLIAVAMIPTYPPQEGNVSSFAIWNIATGERIACQSWEYSTLNARRSLYHSHCEDGKLMVFLVSMPLGHIDVNIWDLCSGKCMNSIPFSLSSSKDIDGVCCSGNKFLSLNYSKSSIDIHEINTAKRVYSICDVNPKKGTVEFVACAGSKIIACIDGEIKVFNAETGELLTAFDMERKQGDDPSLFLLYVDEDFLITVGDEENDAIKIWELSTGNCVSEIPLAHDTEHTYYSEGRIFSLNLEDNLIELVDFTKRK